jgi:DNA-binding transcriptional ArsR family regulator
MTAVEIEQATRVLRALAHAVRLSVLGTLADGERSVGEIERSSGIAQPGLSQQLAILREAGLVTARREARQVYYSIDRSAIAAVAAVLGQLSGARTVAPGGETAQLPANVGAAVFARILPHG